MPEINGSPNADIINGTAGDDQINGGDGNDVIYGGGGADFINPGRGDDTIYGGDGNDSFSHLSLDGDHGRDTFFGEAGDDFSWVAANGVRVDAGSGNDHVVLNLISSGVFEGGAGEDELSINFSDAPLNLVLDGMPSGGSFSIGGLDISGFERMNVWGGAGADVITAGATMSLSIFAGAGDDVIRAGSGTRFARGDAGDDQIYGSEVSNTLEGGTGQDVIYGYDGADTLTGDAGSDQLFGGDGDDFLYGETSTGIGVILPLTAYADDLIDGGAGTDTLVCNNNPMSDYVLTRTDDGHTLRHIPSNTVDTLRGIEKILFQNTWINLVSSLFTSNGDTVSFDNVQITQYSPGGQFNAQGGNDVVRLPTTSAGYAVHGFNGATFDAGDGDDVVWGGLLADNILGSAGNDQLYGQGGNDRLTGGTGADRLEGGSGDDVVDGGEGDDYIYDADGNDVLIGGTGGLDTVTYINATAGVRVDMSQTGAQNTGGAGIDTLSGFEDIDGSHFDDHLTGDGGANWLYGWNGNDVLIGGAGRDRLSGVAGDDVLIADTLTTNDDLADTMSGGAGRDTFVTLGGDTVLDLAVEDVGVLFVNQDAGQTVVFGSGASREVRSYASDYSSYTSFSLTSLPAGGRIVGVAGSAQGANGAMFSLTQAVPTGNISRVSFDADLATQSLAARTQAFHNTIDALFTPTPSAPDAGSAASPAEGPQHGWPLVLAAFLAVAMVTGILDRVVAIVADRLDGGGSGRLPGDAESAEAAGVIDLFGVREDFRQTGAQAIWQSVQPAALRDHGRGAEAFAAMYSNGTGLEAATAGHLVLTAALDYQLRLIETETAVQIDVFADALRSVGFGASGGAQRASVAASAGNDVIVSTTSQHFYEAGGGIDSFIGDGVEAVRSGREPGAGVNQTFDGGSGSDTIVYAFDSRGIHVDLAQGVATGFTIGADKLIAIENAVGGAGNDVLAGSSEGNNLYGGEGNDQLNGRAGNDRLDGGAGFDAALYSGVRRQYVANATTVSGNGEGIDTLISIENAVFVDGTLTFDATSQSAQVMRLYSATLNRTPDQAGLEANVAAYSTYGLLGLANLFVASAEFQTRFGALNNQQFVEQMYVFALGRAGDQAGITAWVNYLNGGATRGNVVVGFSESAENVGRTAATLNAGLWVPDAQAQVIARLYDATFDRLPDVAGLTGWIGFLKGGMALTDIAAAFAGSAEFQTRYGALSNQEFVEQLYRFCLNREGDPAGIAGWTDFLNNGMTRADVLLRFSESPEHAALTAASWLGGIRNFGYVGSPLEDNHVKDIFEAQVLPGEFDGFDIHGLVYDPAHLGLSLTKDDAFVLPAHPDGGFAPWVVAADDLPLGPIPVAVSHFTADDLLVIMIDESLTGMHTDHVDLAWA
ncbi:MAG: DUF4214 domain-containing protein [Alphaproteobacteria bacterium]|nr:DUF4214 domain-containing protein [Alphaproteobacteria bacterium]MBU2379385.1 DUF4214 domain-containing protein [Alphaproteobacteria bacterium]